MSQFADLFIAVACLFRSAANVYCDGDEDITMIWIVLSLVFFLHK